MMDAIPFDNGRPVRVRLATSEDTEGVVAMCRRRHDEECDPFTLSEERVRICIDKALQRLGGILGVIGDPGNLEASVYLDHAQPWYSESWGLHELWTYVLPERRASNNTRDLIAFMKWCESSMGVPLITGIISSVRTKSKIKLYQRSFGEPRGAVFVFSSNGQA
jgi:hypothetical protein